MRDDARCRAWQGLERGADCRTCTLSQGSHRAHERCSQRQQARPGLEPAAADDSPPTIGCRGEPRDRTPLPSDGGDLFLSWRAEANLTWEAESIKRGRRSVSHGRVFGGTARWTGEIVCVCAYKMPCRMLMPLPEFGSTAAVCAFATWRARYPSRSFSCQPSLAAFETLNIRTEAIVSRGYHIDFLGHSIVDYQ